jgi:dipeptidyl aminopeptidase/acylaminoacyl peptidase
MRISIALAAAALIAIPAIPTAKFALTIDNIMRGPSLVGYEPLNVRWSGDSERIYFQWKQSTDPIAKDPDTYVVTRSGSAPQKLSDAEAKLAPPAFGDLSKDRKRIVYARDGDIFVYDNNKGQTRQITQTQDSESSPRWLPDGKRVYFTRSNNLYVMSLDNGSLAEMTDIRLPGAAAPSDEEKKGTDSQEYLKKEEKSLLEVVRERAAKREEDEARRKRENPRKPFSLQARQSVIDLRLSPDEKYVTAVIDETGEKTKKTTVANFVTESAYTEDTPSRDKVGDIQTRRRLAILSVETGEAKWVDLGEKEPGGERERMNPVSPLVWSEDGGKLALLAHANDNKDRWVLALDLASGKTRELVDIHDDDWVDGPGSLTLGWLKGDREVYFQSERTGYSQLYKVPFDGGEPTALTSGKWEVLSAVLSKDKSKFFLTTSEADPGEHQVYEMSADGGERMRLTSLPGHHRAVLSPDEQWIADIYSYTNKPPELYVGEVRPGSAEKKLTSSPAPEFWEYPWLDTPIVTFPARDGALLRAHLYKPANFKKGPAVVFVHGAGYMQNVHRGWSSSYYHEYLFHHFLMEHGYTVLAIDYRGSAGYGRDWRTGIYRHMGGTDLTDNIDAARWLVSQEGVDSKRIGIYGGSYGGFITLMAMFTQPDVFAAGAALRPVTDWAHYNHNYTSNILNQPQKDAEAYRESSPIYFAQGLKGALLICHGMVDTNVHFQDTVRLIQRLIELRKENWEVAVYPVENHGFVQPTSWADEYKRIFALFEKNLKR